MGGHIEPKPNAQLQAEIGLEQGFAVGREVALAIVLPFPALVGPAGFAHVKQQGVGGGTGLIHHEIQGRPLLGGLGPAPKGQGLGPEIQWIEQGCGVFRAIPTSRGQGLGK